MKLPYIINQRLEVVIWIVLAICAAASPFFYSHFPARVATHWNFAGQADGWSGPAFAAFFFPALIIGLYILLTFLPLLDPHRERYQEFNRTYLIIRASFVIFMTALYFVASFNGLGYNIPVGKIVPIGVGLLFIVLGNFLPKLKKNFFVGVRTPWTLSNEQVWQKTHRVSGKIFIAGGLALMLAAFLPAVWALVVLIATVICLSLGTIVYSWLLWRKSEK